MTLPPTTSLEWVADLVTGLTAEADEVGAALVGGDVTRGDAVVVSITALGSGGPAVRRAGPSRGMWWRWPDARAGPRPVSPFFRAASAPRGHWCRRTSVRIRPTTVDPPRRRRERRR